MEKKYIDAEEFKRRVMESAFEANKPDLYDIAKGICEMVDFTPAADVVPVVRCKDCIYWHGDRVSGNCIADGLKTRFALDYCSKAARKTDNAEHCVCCGDVIPEGQSCCQKCEKGETK